MHPRSVLRRAGLPCALTIAMLLGAAMTPARAAAEAKVTELMTLPLEGVPGKEVTMLTVEYPPGSVDPVHRHNASTFVYVLEGTIEMQMEGGEKKTLHPGDTFYEDPKGVHLVGRNLSDSEPAKFVVVLVKNQGAPILVPVKR
jgi:quercetin dioxygenase-like cupin family protein